MSIGKTESASAAVIVGGTVLPKCGWPRRAHSHRKSRVVHAVRILVYDYPQSTGAGINYVSGLCKDSPGRRRRPAIAPRPEHLVHGNVADARRAARAEIQAFVGRTFVNRDVLK